MTAPAAPAAELTHTPSSLSGLLAILLTADAGASGDPGLVAAVAEARAGQTSELDLVAPPSLRAPAVAALADAHVGAGRPILAVTATWRETEELAAGLRAFLPEAAVAEYPSWETFPHERLSPRSDTVGRRLAVLRHLVYPEPGTEPIQVVVAPVRAVLQPQVAGLAELRPVSVATGDEIDIETLVRRLDQAAYVRVDLVERRGEYAVRGGIVDVFPPTEEHPVRVDFWGDTVEEIRWFTVADQRSAEIVADGLWAPPCRELLLTEQVRARAAELSSAHPELAEMFDAIASGAAVDGMEALAPVLVDEMELLTDLLPAETHVLMCAPEPIRTRARDLVQTSQEFLDASWAAAAGGGAAPIDLGQAAYRGIGEVRERALAAGLAWWTVTPFHAEADTEAGEPAVAQPPETEGDSHELLQRAPVVHSVSATAADTYRGATDRAVADLHHWIQAGLRTVLVAAGAGTAERITEVLGDADVPARHVDHLVEPPEPGVVYVTSGPLRSGFVAEEAGLALLTEDDVTGSRAPVNTARRRMPSRRRHQVDPLQLTP
ncbi:MAG TPA: hypothetical protein VK053_23265, partial [Jiangellaceae bacterium]|nr:hypothetical protein [Jiangellaceae bacterium]